MNTPPLNCRRGDFSHWPQSFRFPAVRMMCALAMTSAVLIAIAPPVHAQATSGATIIGHVQNVATGNYLNNARVRVVGTNIEVFTDASGEYRISGVPAGQATLDVFYTGLAPQRIAATVPASGILQQNVEMRAIDAAGKEGETIVMSQFVVQSQRETDAAAIAINEQRFAANRKDVISTDAFGDINQGNIGEFVKFIPGISLDVKDGNSPSGIMIRGFDPNYTNVTMDGGMLASTQIANTQTSSRGFLLEQANINNLSRIEVTKLPTPDMSANLLGGSVNFISKSAFERAREQLTFNAFVSGNSNDLSFEQSPGPGRDDTYKVRPNFDLTYVKPISRRLGFVINFAQSSQYYLQNKSVFGRRYFTGSNINASNFVGFLNNPQTLSSQTSYNPNQIERTSGSIKVDWKPFEHNVVSFTADASANRQQNAGRTLTYNAGSGTPVKWDEHNTFGSTGASGTGSANEGNSYQNRNGLLRHLAGSWTYTDNNWIGELAASYSNSNNRVRDMAKGFWNGLSTSLPNVKTVNLEGIDNSSASFSKATVLDANGAKIDELKIANYNLGKVTSQPANNQDTVKEVRLNVTRYVDLFGSRIGLKAGGTINDMIRDQHYTLWETTYAGPDGILNSGDETAAPFADTRDPNHTPGFGRPGPQWLDPYLVYSAFKDHPTWFVRSPGNMGDTIKNYAVRSPWLHETIKAGYVMADAKFFKNRLRVVGGVRYELTIDEGRGYKQDGNGIYQKDAQGHPIKSGNSYQLLPSLVGTASGGPEQTALIYLYRASYNSRDYGYYFPSLHTTYNITENLLLRAAYAETMGRPNVSDVVPTLYVGDNINFGVPGNSSASIPGYITASNTTLKPWTAKNYDYSLEYYMPRNGMVSFNWYKKDIRNFFSSVKQNADTGLLDTLGLPHDYVGYEYSTRINVADAMIKGWEANINLPLQNLTASGPLERFDSIAKHFDITLNTTHLELSGSRVTASDWKRYIPRSRNAGVRFRFAKVSGNLLLNWRGKMLRDTSSNINGLSSGGAEYIRARYQLDGNIDYQLTKRFALYLAGRNLLNASSEWEVSGPGAADYAAMTNYERYGVQYSLGVRGNF